jgi:hypothetical protein
MDIHGPLTGSRRGFSLPEAVVAVSIFSFMLIPFVNYVVSSSRHATRETIQLESQDTLQRVLTEMEIDLNAMTEITDSSEQFIEFRLDSDRVPGWNPRAPASGGLTRETDPDDDGDLFVLEPSSQTFRLTGDDLHDDDDDGDGRVDAQCRYFLEGHALVRDFNVNESGWGLHRRVLGERFHSFRLSYLGSAQENPSIDMGVDGTAATGDPGESDGVLEAREIDARLGFGNRNGLLDTFSERRAIASVRVFLSQDPNADGKPDFSLETEYTPVYLSLKRIN